MLRLGARLLGVIREQLDARPEDARWVPRGLNQEILALRCSDSSGTMWSTGRMTRKTLTPPDFDVPDPPEHPKFRFEPLGPEHNVADLDAWSSSIDHIHATPGFRPDGWPERRYTVAENMADLEEHRDHHRRRIDFAWTVLDRADPGVVIGCVYLKPDPTGVADAEARSWVRADRVGLDHELRDHLRPWFTSRWPISVRYAP